MRYITKMNFSGKKFAGLLAFAALFGGAAVFAQDKATLDLLVKKGVITQEEAEAVAKQSVLIVGPKEKAVKKLTISGRIHTQFDYISVDDQRDNAPHLETTQQFMIRRAFVGIAADLGGGVKGEVEMDFAAGTGSTVQGTGGTRNLFSKVYASKYFTDIGTLKAGYDKVNFGQEENTSSARMPVVERSLATYFFTGDFNDGSSYRRLGMGNRRTGVFWHGQTNEKNFTYSAAVTNGQQSVRSFGAGNGGMSYWFSAAYTGKLENWDYHAGLNMGYSQNGNSAANDTMRDMWGINPYLTVKSGRFQMPAEFLLASVQKGREDGSDAVPWGVNVTPRYTLCDEFDVVARFSYLDTNGRGLRISDGVRNAPSPAVNYDRAYAVYLGFNWYIIGDALKLTMGYEYARFMDALVLGKGDANAHALRARVQLLF